MDPDYPATVVVPQDLAFGKPRLGELARAAVHFLNSTSTPSVSSIPATVEAPVYHPPPVSAVVPPVVVAPSPGVTSSISSTSEEVSRLNRTLQELLHRVEDRSSVPPAVVHVHTHLAPPVVPSLQGDGGEVDPAAVGGAVLAVLVVLLVVCGYVLRRWYPDQWTWVKRRVRGTLKLLALSFSFLLHRLGDLTHQFGTSSEVSTIVNKNVSLDKYEG